MNIPPRCVEITLANAGFNKKRDQHILSTKYFNEY